MLSYHNDPTVKARIVAQAKRHYDADMLLAGTYGDGDATVFRGCSVGCMAHDIAPEREDYHAVVAEDAGWPEWLAQLSDTLFEGLPQGERETFHVQLREAIPVGVDLEPVRWHLAIARHERDLGRLKDNQEPYAEQCRAALRSVIAYCKLHLTGNATESAAWSARSVAESAESAWSAAWSAARSAESAAWSARSVAESAESAWSAARSAESAAWSARSDHYRWERDTLLALLRDAK